MKDIPFCERVIRATMDVTYENPGRFEFRTSSLPYCPIQDFQDIILNTPISESYSKDFYTRIGTQVHENIQNMSGLSKYGKFVFGSWKCPKCGHIHEVCFRPKKCKECGEFLLEYVELDFNYKGLSGHQDMLACYPCDAEGNFVELDKKQTKLFLKELGKNHNSKKYLHKWCGFEYKTTGTKYIKDPRYTKYLPTPKHFGQIEAYCVMLDLLYDIKVSEYCIIYFSRETPGTQDNVFFKPFVYEWTDEKYDFRLMTIERACETRKYVEKAVKHYSTSKCTKYLNKIIDNRPCKCKKDWEVYMQKKYFKDEVCPYLKYCLNEGITVKKILKDVED